MTSDFVADIIRATNAQAAPTRAGNTEYHITCPDCGHPSSPRNPHCSFSEQRGVWHCFSCGAGGSLRSLAEKLNLSSGEYIPPAYEPKQQPYIPLAWWMGKAGDEIISKAVAHPQRDELWNKYKRLPAEMLEANRLGVGVVPSSHCNHERLLVPIYDAAGKLVCIRGRQFCCDCRGKWLAPGGTRLDLMPLYGSRYFKTGQYIWIVENAVDALQISAYIPESAGAAIYSCSYWVDQWLYELKAAKPACVIIALDNDLVGNGGDLRRQEFIDEWLKTHPKFPKVPAGVKIGNILSEEKVPVSLYKWGNAPFKADIGLMLKQYLANTA